MRKALADDLRRKWQREINGMLGFLERMDAINRPDTDKWYRGQVRHFTERIEQLLIITPKRSEALAGSFRRRLNRCRRFD